MGADRWSVAESPVGARGSSAGGVLLFVFAWKLGTEAFRPLAGEPMWEFIERGGSYGAPLALAWIQGWRRTVAAPSAP
jgi:hypothetical protein